jgi:hypothetical protein
MRPARAGVHLPRRRPQLERGVDAGSGAPETPAICSGHRKEERMRRSVWGVLVGCWLGLAGCGSKDTNAPAVDATGELGLGQDATATADAGSGCAIPCADEFGKADLGKCPKPTATENYACESLCCVKHSLCQQDSDCAGNLGKGACGDTRFTCGCDLDTGACVQTMCRADAECPSGQQCHQGGCRAPLDVKTLHARLLRPWWIGRPGETVTAADLGAQALDDDGNVEPGAGFKLTLANSDAFTIAGGAIQATDKAGKSAVSASVPMAATGQDGTPTPSNVVSVWNLGPLAAGALRITGIDDESGQPLAGKAVVVGLADAATPQEAVVKELIAGQAVFEGVKFPCDLHVVGVKHAPVSVLRYDPAGKPADVVLPSPLRAHADVAMNAEGKIVQDATTLLQQGLRTGQFSYPGVGEAGVGITSLAFGPSLLNFSLESILGPRVRRPFAKDAPSFVNPEPGKPQDIPGGVAFELTNIPVVGHYVLAGTPGLHTQWALAGRVQLKDASPLISEIADGGGDLDIGRVVSLLLPYFEGFRSQVLFEQPFSTPVVEPLTQQNLSPQFPVGLKVATTVPPLPTVGPDSWADVAFLIAGALMPRGEIIPLGLTAGADKGSDDGKRDGVVDGDEDPKNLGQQPIVLSSGPLHSGTRVGQANHVLITAAVVVANKDKGKREGGSLHLSTPGVLPVEHKPGPLLPLPLDSSYNTTTTQLSVQPVAGAQFYRATLAGKQGAQWLVVLPPALAGKTVTLPDLTAWGASEDLGKQPARVYVAAFELREPLAWPSLFGPRGLTELVARVQRTAFYDVLTPIP